MAPLVRNCHKFFNLLHITLKMKSVTLNSLLFFNFFCSHIHVLDEFLDENTAKELRGTFNHKFESPREGNPDRFVWDWWHVPDQYTLMRTTAQDYFDPKVKAKLRGYHNPILQYVLFSNNLCKYVFYRN